MVYNDNYKREPDYFYYYIRDGKRFCTPNLQLAIKRASEGKIEVFVDDELIKKLEIYG
jgi:hypothetical protein|tara:strand:+ start:1040 stop:1213 length:174 start_codon:yes stop_codon:yes gene_type:complete